VPLHIIQSRQAPVTSAQLTVPQTVNRAKELTPVSTSINDEELLTDSIIRPRVSTLSALDDMTPHARDLSLNRRAK
jgi:hypothetical protein